MNTTSNIDLIARERIRQLNVLRKEAKSLESQLRSKGGNREWIRRELMDVRAILTECLGTCS